MRFEVVRLSNVCYTQMQMSGNKVQQPLGRSGGMAPRKIWCSEITSDAV